LKDAFITAKPITGGIGKVLLQRMGWKEGDGLGRSNDGITVPIMVELKMDRKGR